MIPNIVEIVTLLFASYNRHDSQDAAIDFCQDLDLDSELAQTSHTLSLF